MLDMTSDDPVEIGDLVDVLELVERDVGPVAAALLQRERKVKKRVERGQWFGFRIDLDLRADSKRTKRKTEARLLEEVFDRLANRFL